MAKLKEVVTTSCQMGNCAFALSNVTNLSWGRYFGKSRLFW